VRIIYTDKYQHAAPVMQIYLVGMMMNAFAVSHVLPALDKGRFAAINSTCSLVISVTLNIIGVSHWGLIGAAMGSVVTFAFSELWSVQVVSRTLGIKMHQLLTWSALFPTVLAMCFALYGVSMVQIFGSWNVFLTLLINETVYLILFVPCFILAGGYKQFRLFIGARQESEETGEITAASR
jgi:O-antigen/teichoic acid export membrane protein